MINIGIIMWDSLETRVCFFELNYSALGPKVPYGTLLASFGRVNGPP